MKILLFSLTEQKISDCQGNDETLSYGPQMTVDHGRQADQHVAWSMLKNRLVDLNTFWKKKEYKKLVLFWLPSTTIYHIIQGGGSFIPL